MTQSQHIIIVDDEAPAREMVGDYLKMHGFTVTLCDGGKSLRTVIENNVPDLVVLDLNMPGGSSLEAIPQIREESPETQIVVLTMQQDPAFAREALGGGALELRRQGRLVADDRHGHLGAVLGH